uniref:Bug family tripartite tricarboxylate transporter substrate binding protein n=1 Tax=Cupriavidus yeoncheonensis TaxID=1462994 RepID=UPI003F499559
MYKALLRRFAISTCFLVCATSAGQIQAADAWPTRPIRLVVGFPPGGSTDVSARLLAVKMGKILGQPIVVENRAGASGIIAAEMVARSPADGYTLMYTTSTVHGINPNVFARLQYDPLKDFAPIVHVTLSSFVLLATNDLPVRNVGDLVAMAKRKPNGISYASAGPGSTQDLAAALFAARTGTQMLHVPYKGSSPAVNDLMAGQVQVIFDNISTSLPLIRAGKLRALGVAATKPAESLPGVPTLGASGIPELRNFAVTAWGGLVAPAGTPRPLINKLNAAANQAMHSTDLIQRMRENSVELQGGSPEAFDAFIRRELTFWKEAVAAAGVAQR